MTTNNLAAAAQKAVGVGNRLSSQRRSRFANGAPMSRSVGAPMRSATSRKPVRTVAMAPPRKAAPKKDVPMTPSHISARDGAGPHPLDSGGAGWDAVELYDLTGLAWSFTSPSSTEGRNIVKAACKRGGMALKGYSDWRKEDWAKMAAKAGVKFLDTFSTVAGMRGFRVCWAQHGVALMYVPGIRRFYTLADIAAGVADEKAERDAPEVVKVMENVGRGEFISISVISVFIWAIRLTTCFVYSQERIRGTIRDRFRSGARRPSRGQGQRAARTAG